MAGDIPAGFADGCCRFGVPLDLAFLVVALVAAIVSLLALRFGVRSLKPSRLLPVKSISQISTLLGGGP